MYTTVADFEAFTGQDYSLEDEERLTGIIDSAERQQSRYCGGPFYDPDDREADASKDWIELTCINTQSRWIVANDPTAQAAISGPYKSESLGDYRYELKDGGAVASDPAALPAAAAILDYYCPITLPAALTGMGLAGPTRSRPPIYDPDVARLGDVSRGGLP